MARSCDCNFRFVRARIHLGLPDWRPGGFFLAQPSIDTYLHATYFVVGHFHFVMGVAAIFGIFAGTYFWFPKMFGRMMNETLGKIHFWLTFIGVYCILHADVLSGLRRECAALLRLYGRLHDPLLPVHKFITVAALATGAVQLIFLFNLFWSMFRGKLASANPWEATELEWSTPSPPPFDNFGGQHPVVYRSPYEYNVEGAAADFIPQFVPEPVVKA